MKTYPDVGDKIWLSIKVEDKEEDYSSRIEDIKKGQYIVVAAPMYQGVLVKVNVRTPVQVRYVKNNMLYTFKSIVINEKRTPFPQLTLAWPEQIQRIQRRAYVRVPWLITAKFLYLPDEDVQLPYKKYKSYWEEHMFDIFDGVIKDISGGGIRFNIQTKWLDQYPVDVDKYLLVRFTISYEFRKQQQSYELLEKIRVVRNIPLLNKLNKEFGATFVDIHDRDREWIIRGVLQRQRELIKKGLLK